MPVGLDGTCAAVSRVQSRLRSILGRDMRIPGARGIWTNRDFASFCGPKSEFEYQTEASVRLAKELHLGFLAN